MIEISKQEYDMLKHQSSEYINLSNEIYDLVNLVTDMQCGMLKFDNEEVARIIKRYFRIDYELKEAKLKKEEK